MDDDFEELGPRGARGDGDLIIADRDVERLFGGEAQSVGGQEVKEQDGADLLERILSRDNLNRAYKRVKANKGSAGN